MLTESVAPDVIAKMEAAFRQRDSQAAAEARARYAILERSLAKLSAAGAKVVLGADTGVEDHLFGLAEHLELQAMVDAGMTPAQVLVAATSRAAEYLDLDDRGSLVPGKRADLLVLDGSPLDDIVNTRRISRLFINGVEIDRVALRAQIKINLCVRPAQPSQPPPRRHVMLTLAIAEGHPSMTIETVFRHGSQLFASLAVGLTLVGAAASAQPGSGAPSSGSTPTATTLSSRGRSRLRAAPRSSARTQTTTTT